MSADLRTKPEKVRLYVKGRLHGTGDRRQALVEYRGVIANAVRTLIECYDFRPEAA
jgi:hypothetical protein